MRILHVLDHSLPLQSGYAYRTQEILQGQQALGYTVAAVTSTKQGDCTAPAEVVNGIQFYRTVPYYQFLRNIPFVNQIETLISLKGRIEGIISSFEPDIIHAHSPLLTALAVLPIAKKRHIPIVYEVRAFWEDAAVDHGTHQENSFRYRMIQKLETNVFKVANRIVTICDGLKQDIISRGIHADKITVVPNAVEIDSKISPLKNKNAILENLKLKDSIILGFIGSFYQYEGLLFLIDAVEEMIKHNPALKLILVGAGPEENSIRQKIIQRKLQDHIIMPGSISHDEVDTFYQLFDICVFPRLKMRLTDLVTPLKPLEAMYHGVPVLASNVGGHEELIEDRKTGFLFQSGSTSDFCRQLEFILNNPVLKANVIESAHDFVINQRSWGNNVKTYKSLYEDLQPTE